MDLYGSVSGILPQKRSLGEGRVKILEEKLMEKLKSVNETYLLSLKALYWRTIIPHLTPFGIRWKSDKVDRATSSTGLNDESKCTYCIHMFLKANSTFARLRTCPKTSKVSSSICHQFNAKSMPRLTAKSIRKNDKTMGKSAAIFG